MELFGYPDLSKEEEKALEAILGEFSEVAVTSDVIHEAIKLRRATKIRVPDALIAASAVVTESVLVSRNVKDFELVRHLKFENPFNSIDM